jgi:general secretion pathway protein K
VALGVLKRLGTQLKLPEELWNSLADWMDSDDLTRSNGAESSYYRSLKQPYSAHNGKLMTISELSLVKGFTPEYVAAVQPFVTVYAGPQSLVNINTASKEVLMALDEGIDGRMAERIMEARRLKPFTAYGDLSTRIPGAGNLPSKLTDKANFNGTLFRITSVGRVKETARTVEAVVRMSGGSPEILSWQEY